MALGCKWVDKDRIFDFKRNEKLWLAQVKDYFHCLEMPRAKKVHQWEAIAGLTGWYHTDWVVDIFVHVCVHRNGVSVCKYMCILSAISLVFWNSSLVDDLLVEKVTGPLIIEKRKKLGKKSALSNGQLGSIIGARVVPSGGRGSSLMIPYQLILVSTGIQRGWR